MVYQWGKKTTSNPRWKRWGISPCGKSPSSRASFITFLLLVRPFLLKLQGVSQVAANSIAVPAHFTWSRADKRREFLRVRRNAAGGLDLFPNQSSGVLTSAVWGDGVVDNPPGRTIAPGDVVQFVPFAEWLS